MSDAKSMPIRCYYNEGDGCGKWLRGRSFEFSDTTGMKSVD
jgi:hypothetical protein